MAELTLGPGEALFYEHVPPADGGGRTFVFFNALIGDHRLWDGEIAAALRRAGHGTLLWAYRGQTPSRFVPGTDLSAALIVDDALRLLAAAEPARPVLVGLAHGGLHAVRTHLARARTGTGADGLVLINGVRRPGPRQRWLDEAAARCVEVGGLDLYADLYTPLMFGEDWLATHRARFLKHRPYVPFDHDSGPYLLLAAAGTADWAAPWEDLDLPVLLLTGAQDRLFLDPDHLDAVAARLPRARRRDVPGAGHLLPMERPGTVADALLDFVGGLPDGG